MKIARNRGNKYTRLWVPQISWEEFRVAHPRLARALAFDDKDIDRFWYAVQDLQTEDAVDRWYIYWAMTKRHLRQTGRPELARLIDIMLMQDE